MSTLQKTKTSDLTKSGQLFPTSVTTTETSLAYMKRLTAVAVSNILYLRNVFTEDCYGHRKLDQLKLRILSEKCETMGAKQIVHWVKGCFDAMERQYLKQMTLGLYSDPNKPDELIEAYTFRFTYDNNQCDYNISLSKNNKKERVVSEQRVNQELKTSTIQLLRSLIVMVQSLDKLPNDCFLTMKLLYYDDITPPDYEPPGFGPTDKDSFTFNGKPISISAGEVITPFHSLRVKIRTNQEQFQDFGASHSPQSSQTCGHGMQSDEALDDCTPLAIESHDDVENRPNGSSHVSPKSPPFPTNRTNSQKSKERSVISKIKELTVDDNEDSFGGHSGTGESSKRKLEFEVTQDSLFNSMPTTNEKRFKASKSQKSVPIKNRIKYN